MIHDALYDWLRGDAQVTELFVDRIYHEWIPQQLSTWPALSFVLTSGQDFADDMDDPSDNDIDQSNYQFDVWANNSADAVHAANRFDRVFNSLRGRMGAVSVQHVERTNRIQLGEQIGDKQRRRVSLDYRIFHNTIEA